jgi:hypothetical protein
MKKVLRGKVPLLTSNGKTIVPMEITYDDSEVIANPQSEITLLYNGMEYKGCGDDYLWIDTLADLQTKLPKDVTLACCMTCRHGNMCPYGNEENQLICTKGITITSKEDMLNLFDQTDPFEERAVASSALLGEFTSPTQPFPVKPVPFSRQYFSADSITDLSDSAHEYIKQKICRVKS